MTQTRVDAALSSVDHATRVRRFCVHCSYDGTNFRGFAENDGVRTVAGELRRCLEQVFQQPLTLTCSGRTDAGVHAWSQYVTFDVDDTDCRSRSTSNQIDAERVQQSLSRLVSNDIGIHKVVEVSPTFDARFSATWRAYRYVIGQERAANPFLDRYSWRVGHYLDDEAMKLGAALFLGEHDFTSFCRKVKQNPDATLIRRMIHIDICRLDQLNSLEQSLLGVDLVASAFCHQMVRSIVGLLVDIGLERRGPQEVETVLLARDRNKAGTVAPPHGLHLLGVGFESEFPWSRDPLTNQAAKFSWP